MAMNLENKKQILVIILAVGAGIAAIALTGNYVSSSIKQKEEELAQQLAAQQQKFFDEQERSRQAIQTLYQEIGNIRAEQQQALQQQQQLIQQQIAAQQQQQQEQQPEQPEVRASLALKTPPGKRAITVMVDSLAAVGGLINPGDIVDVIAHLNVPKTTEAGVETNTMTVMIFQSLQILAINTNIDQPGKYDEQQGTLRITFAVDPQEAGLMTFADKNGNMELALRTPTEKKHNMMQASTWKTLADYILENHGADIGYEPEVVEEEPEETEEVKETEEEPKPYIQIFRAGKEL